MKKKIVIFASGSGSNFIKICENISLKNINAKILLLVSNNSKSGAVKYAKSLGINVFIYSNIKFKDDKNQNILFQEINKYKPDLILLAGYLKKISKSIINFYDKKILNIHPSLLPKYGGKGFYGMNVHKNVYKNKDNISGATIHFVDYNYDTGPILIQKQISLDKCDSPKQIAKKVLNVEHQIYPKAVELFCNNKIIWTDNKPIIKE
tara:strand:+ start:129 stop:749 length:621 start_codon:yes stop_codon:yes gene_type:complete